MTDSNNYKVHNPDR